MFENYKQSSTEIITKLFLIACVVITNSCDWSTLNSAEKSMTYHVTLQRR